MQYLLTEEEFNNLQSNKKESVNYFNIIYLLNVVDSTQIEDLIENLTSLAVYPEQTDFIFEKWLKLYPIN